ncbi:MAG: hypothetical protein ACFE9L_01395 [Candidatus Hodarchaeota archaeon]
MIDELLRLSAGISMILFSGLFIYAAVKFFRIWRKFHEESLFHLGMLSLGMVIYFLIIMIMLVFTEDTQTAVFIIKRIIGIIYSLLSLELSLFYVTAFTNRRSLWEKYIPFTFGITTGASFALLGMIEVDPWHWILLIVAYVTPLLLIAVLVVRIVIRSYFILKFNQLTAEDRGFIKALVGAAIILFTGAIGDISFFWYVILVDIDIWSLMTSLSGIITPLIFIFSVYLVRTIFTNIEEANIVHVMNLLS